MRWSVLGAVLAACSAYGGRVTEPFNAGWGFEEKGVSTAVDLPHDWAIAGPFDPKGWGATGKLPWKDRTATYRRTLVLPKGADGRRHLFRFDGAMAHATAFVNGMAAGRGDYGYLGFSFDATPYLRTGTNVVEVRVDTCNMRSRFYCGGGLYRNAWHVTTDAVRFDDESVFVTTPEVSSESAVLSVTGCVRSHLSSASSATVTATLRDPDGTVVARREAKLDAAAFAGTPFELGLTVAKPRLWRMKPGTALYALELGLSSAAGTDGLTKRVGFRFFRFDADRGFFLNGERVQLNGVNLHSDLGPLGMAVEKGAIRRQLAVMREMGANAIRTSHNPPSPEFLDICDEMGFFVWDETFDKWNETCGRGDEPLEEFVPRQLRRHVRRDRNHPCVFVWSIGNEITSNGACPPGQEAWAGAPEIGTTPERCAVFRDVVRALDATRPVAIGSCFKSAIGRGDYAALDLTGWNYGEQYLSMRAKYPAKPVVYSESASAVSSFGYYADRLPANKTDYGGNAEAVDSYDRTAAPWSDIPDREFERMERDTFCAGEFVWTGIDYLGEPTPREARSSYFGICDLLALPKDRYYLYRAHWNKEAFTLHLVPHHWNFGKGRVLPVYVYTSADEAELFVNGRSFGRRRKDPRATMKDGYYAGMPRYRLIWENVAYEPGEISVVAYGADGKALGTETLRTAGPVAGVRVDCEKPYDDLVFARVTAVDAKGTPVPDATNRVAFAVKGPAKILAVGNADPFGMESFKDVSSHRLHCGRLGIYLKRMGEGAIALEAQLALEVREEVSTVPRWLSVSPLGGVNEQAVADDLRRLGRETVIDAVAWSCTLVPEADPAVDKAAVYAARCRKLHELLEGSGLKEGILLQATMGHGWTPGSPTPWQKVVRRDGSTMYKFCPLGKPFLSYIDGQVRQLAELRPDFFMVDDDTRLNTGVNGCFCPLHLAEFARRTGRSWTREELAAAVEKDVVLAKKWDDLLSDSVAQLMETIRRAFPAGTPGQFCCCNLDSHQAGRMARILAADGQDPVVRINNAMYLCDSLRRFPAVMSYAAREIGDLPAGTVVMDEADPCPQNRYSMDATRLLHHITMMTALEGCAGAKIWLTRLSNPHETASGLAYRELLVRKNGFLKVVSGLGLVREGVVVPLPRRRRFAVKNSYEPHDWGTAVFGRYGVAYRTGFARPGDVVALNKDVIDHFEDAELADLLAHPCLLDGSAALALTVRGFSSFIGVTAKPHAGRPINAERYRSETLNASVPTAADLSEHDPKAVEASRLLNRASGLSADATDLGPGSLSFVNARGARIVTLAAALPRGMWLTDFSFYSETRKREILRILAELGGGAVPGGVAYPGDAEVLLATGTASDGRRVVLADNAGLDALESLPLDLAVRPKSVLRLADDGRWQPIAFSRTEEGIRLETKLETYRPAVFELK